MYDAIRDTSCIALQIIQYGAGSLYMGQWEEVFIYKGEGLYIRVKGLLRMQDPCSHPIFYTVHQIVFFFVKST